MSSLARRHWRVVIGASSLTRRPWRVVIGASSLAHRHWRVVISASSLAYIFCIYRKSDETNPPHKEITALHKRARDLLVESCLAVANFKIDEVSLGLHSRG